jgi:hypothetical protein
VDISSINGVSFVAKFWASLVDDYSGYCWNKFKEKVIDLIKELKNFKFLSDDDAGENFAL